MYYKNLFDDLNHSSVTNMQKMKKNKHGFFTPLYIYKLVHAYIFFSVIVFLFQISFMVLVVGNDNNPVSCSSLCSLCVWRVL